MKAGGQVGKSAAWALFGHHGGSLRSGGGWRDVQPTAGNTEHVVPLVADVITGRSDCAEINLRPGDKVSKLYNQ